MSAFGVVRRPATSGNRESPSGRAAPDFGVEPVELPRRSGRSLVLALSPSRSPALPARGRGRPVAPTSLRGGFGVGGQLRNPVVPAGGGRRPGGRRKSGGCRPTRRSSRLPEADEHGKSSSGSLGAVRISFRVTGSAFGVARRPATSENRESPSGRAAPDFGVEPVELPVVRDEAEFSPFPRPDLPQSGRDAAGGPSRISRYHGASAWVGNFENPVVLAGGVLRVGTGRDD